MVFQKKPKPTPATTDAELFDKEGHASQLEQYDDITLRNMEVINLYANMQSELVSGSENYKLMNILLEFHKHFTGLYGATWLESEKYLEIPYKETDKTLLDEIEEGAVSELLGKQVLLPKGLTVGQKIKQFVDRPLIGALAGNLKDNKNRPTLQNSIKNAVEIFYLYEAAIQKAGYRKTTFKKMKQSEKWRENF